MREFRTALVEMFHDWNQFSSVRCAGHRRYGKGSGKLTFTGVCVIELCGGLALRVAGTVLAWPGIQLLGFLGKQ